MQTTTYSQLRRLAEQRSKRLESAGFPGYHAPKVKEISDPKALRSEQRKLEKWLATEGATVKGARIQAERREAEAAERRRRHAEKERERYWRKKAEEGRAMKTRPPKLTDEERRQHKRESNKRYREKKKRERERERERTRAEADISAGIGSETDPKIRQAYKNLLSGLKKHGIEIKSWGELKAWGKYIKERNDDSDRNFYWFDQWISDVVDPSGNTPESRDDGSRHITAEDIYNTIMDFNSWSADNQALEAEMEKPRRPDEYTGEEFAGMWHMYMHNKRGR